MFISSRGASKPFSFLSSCSRVHDCPEGNNDHSYEPVYEHTGSVGMYQISTIFIITSCLGSDLPRCPLLTREVYGLAALGG